MSVIEAEIVAEPEEPLEKVMVRTSRRGSDPGDPRALRSRMSLRQALLRLVEHRNLDKVTLREITVEAGVSYPTFFNHYDDKEDLFQDIVSEEIGRLLAAFRQDRLLPGWHPGRGMCACVQQRRGLWRSLLTTGASEAMRSEFIRRGRELASDRDPLRHGLPFDVVSGVIAGGSFEILAWWLATDGDDDFGPVADALERLVIEPALDLPRGYFGRTDRPIGAGPG